MVTNHKFRPSNLIGPLCLALLVGVFLYTGGVKSVVGFAAVYFGFIGKLLAGCLGGGGIFFSIKLVHEKTEQRWGEASGVVALFLYVLVGLPVLLAILDALL